MNKLIVWCLFYSILIKIATSSSSSPSSSNKIPLYTIEGQVVFPSDENVLDNIRILVDEGLYIGIPRVDGTFVISGIPSGSYIVAVNSPFHIFEPVRVDINSKGKIRARAVNFIEPGKVVTMKYPLRFESHTKPNYFQKREEYHLTDILLNPTFFPIILAVISIPLVLIFLKQQQAMQNMQDAPEIQETVQRLNNFIQPNYNYNFPDIIDWLITHVGGARRIRSPPEETTDSDSKQNRKKSKREKNQAD
ncbi:unnamed protein product [Adineta steineri]|uniref:ER membrane protein complex subunit 7 beta-sandwich domain-containing protein n=1 Tax=Adineta steineri TaxID=433720 RepID=A0A814AJH4_9BILA|nr:unnamed protein product [Adineta steineri]CAF4112060.1 unnamed protein product [Adineta steineri]